MSPKSSDKNKEVIKELEKTISPVLVVNNSTLKPYVELFEYSPENIYQQPLGSLVGFFEVKEYSDESAYVVNFLTSVLKKEYYVNPKRSVTESLDSALHKVNLALSELAKHGNVEWLGKLHAAICVLEKNSAHFSVAGEAKLLLYRSGSLTDISDGLASDSLDPHPLKTFVNVSSGRIEKDDRLLIASEDIFHILTLAELKKNFQRLEREKFVQFLKTALSNQIEMIATVVVDIHETLPAPSIKRAAKKKEDKPINAFSEKTFSQTVPASQTIEAETDETQQEPSEYTDKKTGHIYVQGEAAPDHEASQAQMYWELTKEKMADGWYHTKNSTRRKFSLYKKSLAKKKEEMQVKMEERRQRLAEEKKQLEQQRTLEEMERQEKLEREKLEQLEKEKVEQAKAQELKIKEEKEKEAALLKQAKEEILTEDKQEDAAELKQPTAEEYSALSFKEKLALATKQQRSAVIDLRTSAPKTEIEKEIAAQEEDLQTYDEPAVFDEEETDKKRIFASLAAAVVKTTSSTAEKISKAAKSYFHALQAKTKKIHSKKEKSDRKHSRFSKIGHLIKSLTYQQKLYFLAALLLVFVVPFFIARWLNRPVPHQITELETAPPSPSQTLASDKNINLNSASNSVITRSDLVAPLVANTGLVAATKNSVLVLSDGQQKEYQLPAGLGTVTEATYMADLSLVLLLTDQNKVVSFSPTSLKFTENAINLDGVSQSSFIGTYLTYMYVLDPKANQIYRYPRADGGFGDKTAWYKDSMPLSDVSDMTIDDNIYCIEGNDVYKLFKGKKVDFTLEKSATPVHLDKIYTTSDLTYLYALDAKNDRVVQYGKDGQIISQFFNESLGDGKSLAVDEKNKTAYVGTSSGLVSISLQ